VECFGDYWRKLLVLLGMELRICTCTFLGAGRFSYSDWGDSSALLEFESLDGSSINVGMQNSEAELVVTFSRLALCYSVWWGRKILCSRNS
jgi:hypothetical protein